MDRQRRWPLHQINVITALIRQPFNLKGAWTERERERQAEGKRGRQQDRKGGKRREPRLHSDVRTSHPHTSSHLLLQPFTGSDELPGYCVSRVI